MDSLPPGHHPDWRTSVLLLIWGTASPEGFLGTGGSCLPRYAGAPREHGLAMLGAPGGLCWTGSPSTHQWAYPAHTRGSFRFTTKGTKGVPGALPLDPVGGHYHPPSSAPRCSPQKGEGATKGSWICHFEVVRAIGISFSWSSIGETPTAFKPWRGDYRCRMCRLCRFCVKFVSGNLA